MIILLISLIYRQERIITDRKSIGLEDEDRAILLDSGLLIIELLLVIDDYLYLVFNNDSINLKYFVLPLEFNSVVDKYRN